MRIRKKSYEDYGIGKEEKKKVFQFCQNPSEADKKIILDAIECVNPEMAKYLYMSIVQRKSYSELYKQYYIPMSENDFYGYRRKAVSNIFYLCRLREGGI